MGYKVGDMVVYPRHGAAKVEAITERTVKGVTREYLQLSVLSSDGLVINVPVDNAKKVGVRDIVGAKEVAKVFEILRTPIIEKEMNWSRRYKLNVEKIATGDVNKIAEVVRDLSQRDVDEHVHGRALTGQIKVGEWLVQHKQLRVGHQRLRDGDALTQTSRELGQAV